MRTPEETFRRLTIGDPRLLAVLADDERADRDMVRPDEQSTRLFRLAALIAMGAPQSAYDAAVAAAVRSGADLRDLVGVLLAVAGEVGSVRVVTAAPQIARAAGYDIDAALEALAPGR